MVIYFVALCLTFIPMKKLVKITVEPFVTIDSGNYWTTYEYELKFSEELSEDCMI